MDLLRVGELARRTGLTVRTLHHYDEIGLLRPARRTEACYRLYGAGDVERLTRILVLRGLGLSLDEIRSWLDEPDLSLERTLGLQIERLGGEIERSKRLLRRLEALAARAASARGAPVEDLSEELIETLEMMTMYEKHFTAEQLRELEKRGATLGEDRIQRVQEVEWPTLIAEVRAAMERGVDPASAEARALAARWMGLVAEFTGGDPGIARSVAAVYREEPSVRGKTGIDAAMFDWIRKVQAAGEGAG